MTPDQAASLIKAIHDLTHQVTITGIGLILAVAWATWAARD